MIKICTSCGAQVPEGSRFCPECGSEIKDLCPNCGAPITGTKFCPECGHKLDILIENNEPGNLFEEVKKTEEPEPVYRTVQQPPKQTQTRGNSSTPFEVEPAKTESAFSTAKVKKPFYQKWWFWLIIGVVLLFAFAGGGSGSSTSSTSVTKKPASTTAVSKVDNKDSEADNKADDMKEDAEVKEAEKEDESAKVPTEYKNALRSAQLYADTMYMSKAAIYDQLTSEYGEQFPAEAAQYAIDNLDVDWNANALKTAKNYQETMSMSKAAIYDQLISEYGEKFTAEQAQYAIDHLE